MRFERIRRKLKQRSDDAGFSLVELAVAIGVFSIVMTVIFGTVINVMNASNAFEERTREQSDARLAIDTLVRDLRQAYTGRTDLDSVVFPTVANTITFWSPDRAVDFHLRKITYVWTPATGILTRSVVTTSNTRLSALAVGSLGWSITGQPTVTAPVLTGVINTTPPFVYRDGTLAGIATTSASLRAVMIHLVLDQSPTTSPTAQTYDTQVDLRVSQ